MFHFKDVQDSVLCLFCFGLVFFVLRFLLKIVDIMFQASASRDIKQFQYTTWPESGSPDSGIGIIELIGQVQKWNNSINNKIVTVHCR